MGKIKKQYGFRGLDTRTNKLYRAEGTASDCRNVRLDSTRKLVKINDMDEKVIPRGVALETGLFEDKMPFESEIIDIMPYKDHFVVCCKYRQENIPTFYKDVVIFYRWDKDANTVTKLPFQSEVYPSADIGQILYKNGGDMVGKFQYTELENVLYFCGNEYPEHNVFDGSRNVEDLEYNRSPVFSYDGTLISQAGCPSILADTITDIGPQTSDEYVRMLPFKIDALGRHIFGNYSTHLGQHAVTGAGDTYIRTDFAGIDNSSAHQVAFEVNAGFVNLTGSDSAALRTIGVSFFQRDAIYKSAGKGQILYGIKHQAYGQNYGGFPPTARDLSEFYHFYKCVIEDVDYVLNTVTLGEFETYNPDTGLWEASATFEHISEDISTGTPAGICILSNIICAIYGSDNFAFGYKLRGFRSVAYGLGTVTHTFYTSKGYTSPPGAYPLGSAGIVESASDLFLYISEDMDDIYDISTVKLPPPKVTSMANYVGALVVTDEKSLYFSDFSVGGSVEVFNPLDTFGFGSSDKGPVTGIFSNETFLVGFREQEAYYITGNIFTANYRIQSYKSTRIGCSDSRSITEYRGGGIFASEKGIFMAQQGGNMQEVSDSIENVFTDNYLGFGLDMFDVKAVVDFKREYIYFAVGGDTPVIFAYSYYHNDWFIYDYISTSGGFDLIDGILYSSNGTNIFVEDTGSTQAEAYYRSNFETLQVPSVEKKFIQALLFTIDSDQYHTIDFKTYRNWDESAPDTDESKEVSAAQVDVTQRFNPKRSKSAAIEIGSKSNQQLIVNGYEYEYMDDIGMFKNDD